MKEKMLKRLANILFKIAVSASGAASDWNVYQPKEPEILKKLRR